MPADCSPAPASWTTLSGGRGRRGNGSSDSASAERASSSIRSAKPSRGRASVGIRFVIHFGSTTLHHRDERACRCFDVVRRRYARGGGVAPQTRASICAMLAVKSGARGERARGRARSGVAETGGNKWPSGHNMLRGLHLIAQMRCTTHADSETSQPASPSRLAGCIQGTSWPLPRRLLELPIVRAAASEQCSFCFVQMMMDVRDSHHVNASDKLVITWRSLERKAKLRGRPATPTCFAPSQQWGCQLLQLTKQLLPVT
jgi:hypothetical protein